MTELIRWGRPTMLSLQRDVEDMLDDFSIPRAFRREIDRLFDQPLAPPEMWREMDRLFDQFEPPPTLRRRLGRLFENFAGTVTRPFKRGQAAFVPALDLKERDGEYVLKADLPGIREQDVDISIDDDNVLTVRGERREEETKRERGYQYTERSCGSFSRSVSLPSGIDATKIEADFRNGVLEVHVPKAEAARARKIPIGREEPRVLGSSNGPPPAQPKVS